jgi:hypothetical protein
MTPEQFELLYTLKDLEISFKERYSAARDIDREAMYRRIGSADIPLFYHSMVAFWRNLNLSITDRNDTKLFDTRKKLANICRSLSHQLPEGRKFFKYYPAVKRAEGFDDRFQNKLMVGEIRPGYGTSLYEFHWEYPVEGAGIRKDLISVITGDNQKIPMLEWCRQNDMIVFCNRCGLDITYEVSRDCPFMKWRFSERS